MNEKFVGAFITLFDNCPCLELTSTHNNKDDVCKELFQMFYDDDNLMISNENKEEWEKKNYQFSEEEKHTLTMNGINPNVNILINDIYQIIDKITETNFYEICKIFGDPFFEEIWFYSVNSLT